LIQEVIVSAIAVSVLAPLLFSGPGGVTKMSPRVRFQVWERDPAKQVQASASRRPQGRDALRGRTIATPWWNPHILPEESGRDRAVARRYRNPGTKVQWRVCGSHHKIVSGGDRAR
jgi:hypothetical protein